MSNAFERLLFLVASSGLSRREIEQALREASLTPPSKLASSVILLREAIDRGAWHQLAERSAGSTIGVRQETSSPQSAAARANNLLREIESFNVSLGVASIIKACNELALPQPLMPQFRNKDGFLRWLRRIEVEVGGRKLLQIAHVARDKMTKDRAPPDWPLKGS